MRGSCRPAGGLLGAVLIIFGGGTLAAQTMPIDVCGTIASGVTCPLIFVSDPGPTYLLDGYGSFGVDDRARVVGILDSGCVTVCLQGSGCIAVDTIEPCPPPAQELVRGDCNGDGTNDIADAVHLLGNLFPGGNPPNPLPCADACDGNDDGSVNIADAISILGSLFGSPTTPLPPPFPSCGPDPTASPSDPLDCETYTAC